MHPPPFRFEHKLSDWPACILELRCCKGTVKIPVKLLIVQQGDQTFRQVVNKLRCNQCGKPPAPVYLCASHHRTGESRGPTPD